MPLNCRLNVLQIMLYIQMVENVLEILDSLAVSCGPFRLWKGSYGPVQTACYGVFIDKNRIINAFLTVCSGGIPWYNFCTSGSSSMGRL